MKKESGITVITLVIVVIVTVILATAGITGVVQNQKDSKISLLESELRMVQHAVIERKTQADITSKEYEELPR